MTEEFSEHLWDGLSPSFTEAASVRARLLEIAQEAESGSLLAGTATAPIAAAQPDANLPRFEYPQQMEQTTVSPEQALKKITLIIPCFNEADGVGKVIDLVPRDKLKAAGFQIEVIVVDNASSDDTRAVALSRGVRIIEEPARGKGRAIRTGLAAVKDDCDYVVMIDGDDSYKLDEILRLLEPLESGFCDVVMGSRLAGRMTDNSMRGTNRLGNWFFSFIVRHFFKVNTTDTLSGYFAWRADVIKALRPYLKSSGFAIEMEMITKMARMGYQIYSVPITYAARAGESSLRPFHDGRRIMATFLKNLFWRPREKKVVAFVTDAVSPFHNGGKEKHLHEVSRRLVRHGREVHIYTMQWWQGEKNLLIDGIHYHAICRLHPLYAGNRRSIKQGLLFALACLKLFNEPFDVVDVDHIPFFPLFSMKIVCLLKRKKLYATWHEVWGREYWLEYLGGLKGYFGYAVEKLAMKMPSVFISVSDHTTRRLRAAGVRREVQTVLNGVDFEPIHDAPVYPEANDVIYAGRLIDHKNVDMLIRAIARVRENHPGVRCVIIGDGPEKPTLESMISSLGLEKNVKLQDFLTNHQDLYSWIKASRMLVLPSIREGFGLIVAEANACDTPVITTGHKNNAARELIIEGKNGYLSDPNDRNLADKINRLLDEEDKLTPRQTFLQEFGDMNWSQAAAGFNEVLV